MTSRQESLTSVVAPITVGANFRTHRSYPFLTSRQVVMLNPSGRSEVISVSGAS